MVAFQNEYAQCDFDFRRSCDCADAGRLQRQQRIDPSNSGAALSCQRRGATRVSGAEQHGERELDVANCCGGGLTAPRQHLELQLWKLVVDRQHLRAVGQLRVADFYTAAGIRRPELRKPNVRKRAVGLAAADRADLRLPQSPEF